VEVREDRRGFGESWSFGDVVGVGLWTLGGLRW